MATAKKASKKGAKKGVKVNGVRASLVSKGAKKPRKACKSISVSKKRKVLVCPE